MGSLEEAVAAHNNLLDKEDRVLNNLKIRPTLINSSFSGRHTLGLSINYHLNYK